MTLLRLAVAALFALPAVAVVAQPTPTPDPSTPPAPTSPETAPTTPPAPQPGTPGDAAFPPSTQPNGQPNGGMAGGMAPATIPTGDAAPVVAATTLADPATLTTPVAAAREYFAVIKAGSPRAATSAVVDFDSIAVRCFGDDYRNSPPLEQAEIRELLRQVVFIGFLDPRVSTLMSQLTYENFVELPSASPDTRDVELEAHGGPVTRVKQRLTFAKVNGNWRIVDLWQNTNTLSHQLNTLWGQARQQAPQLTLVNFCRLIIIPRQQQQQAPQQAPAPQPMPGPSGPSTPSIPTPPPTVPMP